MSSSQRTQPRYRVHMTVRYQAARDFVVEYAENLSKGGLFIRGAQHLAARDQVLVEVTLPGYPPFKVLGEVAHVLDPETADRIGRAPGAGLAVVKAPSNYEQALRGYLRLLGRRRDCLVFAEDRMMREALEEAGYQANPMPPEDEVVMVLRAVTQPVLGLLVSRGRERDYAAAAFSAGFSSRLFALDHLEELDALLPRLDEGIPRTT